MDTLWKAIHYVCGLLDGQPREGTEFDEVERGVTSLDLGLLSFSGKRHSDCVYHCFGCRICSWPIPVSVMFSSTGVV